MRKLYPALPPPDWDALPGGDDDTSAWLTAWERKQTAFAAEVAEARQVAQELAGRDALFSPRPEVLHAVPAAAQFYLDLAGVVSKLAPKLKPSWTSFGLKISPLTVAGNLARGKRVADQQLAAFCAWISSILDERYPRATRDQVDPAGMVLMVRGARVHGQVQNKAGDDAVLILKELLVRAMLERGVSVEVAERKVGPYMSYTARTALERARHIRFGGRMVCEFVPGGNRPDMRVLLHDVVILNAEVKGRKDLSNIWESWIPQINGHLRTWTQENPDAPRVLFGTVITTEMIEGRTAGGTQHTGLKAFHRSGLLTTAYNLTNIRRGDRKSVEAFNRFVDELCAVLGVP